MKTVPKKVNKPWGYELWLANDLENDYCGKILHVNKGHKFSMHFHVDKHEAFYVLLGKAKLRTIDTSNSVIQEDILHEGDVYIIDRLLPHQIEAIEELDIIESSTYHKDEDSYRIWRG